MIDDAKIGVLSPQLTALIYLGGAQGNKMWQKAAAPPSSAFILFRGMVLKTLCYIKSIRSGFKLSKSFPGIEKCSSVLD